MVVRQLLSSDGSTMKLPDNKLVSYSIAQTGKKHWGIDAR